jgi:hypothetical protein
MATAHDDISPDLAAWIHAQPVFFVATAPESGGHVNVSPKGLDSLRVLGPKRVAYLDLTGSGVETIAHVRDNGRVTLMWCAFVGNPRIARVYGRGCVHPIGTEGFDDLAAHFPELPGRRSIVEIEVDRVSTSCGYAVPLMRYEGERDRLLDWARNKGDNGLATYWQSKNAESIDGLPGLPGVRG